MDGSNAGQMALPSQNLLSKVDDRLSSKKRRSRKPQETFRRQNTDDVMADLVEYDEAENSSPPDVGSDTRTDDIRALALGMDAGVSAVDLYHRAVEMWHNYRDLDRVYGDHGVSANAPDLSMLQQFGDFSGSEQFFRESMPSHGSAGHANITNNHEIDEDEQEETEDDFLDEDFNLYEDNEDHTNRKDSTFDVAQPSPKRQSSSVTCEVCERTFKGRSQLASHMKTHRRPLVCTICSIRFSSEGSLLWHQRFVHASQKYNHTCEVCGETVRLKQDLMSHYMTHRLGKKVVKCVCGQSFRNTVTLKLHEMNLCPMRGQDNESRRLPEKTPADSVLSTETDAVLPHDERQVLSKYQLDGCSLVADEKNDGVAGEEVQGDDNSVDDSALVSYPCPFCGQMFHSKGLYTIHTKKHTKPHSCDICGRGFAKKFTMECHRKTHLGQKDYRCDLCGQAFTLRPQLSKHKLDNHEMENGVSCPHCDAKFKNQNLLQRHLAYYCSEAPTSKDADPSGATSLLDSEELRCAECDKVFDTQWSLAQHAKYHQRRFSCEICGNKYGERFLLQSHLLTHLGVRPYKCTVCGASFTMKAHCERHCRMHLRAQHFECETCGYMFRYEHDRLTHTSKFCLGTREEKPDVSKMMLVEKPDFAQLGVTSKMLGYTTPPPSAAPPSPSSNCIEPNTNEVAPTEDGEKNSSPKENVNSESVAGESTTEKLHLKCHICGKKLKKKAVLTLHLAREHGIGEEPFKCFICGQGSAFEKAMRLHLESHLPYKMYRCATCGVRFSNKRSLASHALHEKCLVSSRRPSDASNAENNDCTEIVFVDEDLSELPNKSFGLEMDLDVNASQENVEDDRSTTKDELETECKFSSEKFDGVQIKEEMVDDGYEGVNDGADGVSNVCEGVNGNSCSNADEEDDDDDRTICNSIENNLSPAEDQEQEHDSKEPSLSEDVDRETGNRLESEAGTEPSAALAENNRLVCVIKKEKNGSGYKIRQLNEELAENLGGITAEEMVANEETDEERRSQMLSLPLRVKVMRDRFGNERVFVNGELFPFWFDYALRTCRTTDVGCRDFKAWCETCQRFIVGKYKYRVHMQRHSHSRPFACDFCNKAFKTTENLRTHMRWHDPSRLIVCSICGAKCVSPSDMKRHMTVHEGVKPYVCSTCGKGFRRKMYLNTHVRTHTGETPFSCDVCGRRFRIYSSLHDHQKLHSGYKPFECSVCHKRFAQRANWRTHERRHKGVKNFECEVCQKGFVQNYELQNHRLRCVKQDLPYICLLCGMKFTKEHPLKRHINRHSCGICGKQFVIMKEKVSHQLRCRRRSKSESKAQP